MVILQHCSGFINIPYISSDFGIVGSAAVGLFFFFSGYGLEVKKEKDSLKLTELPLRICKLLYKLIIPTILFYLINILLNNSIIDVLINTFEMNFYILPYSWFIITLCILYILFYLSYILTKRYHLHSLLGFIFILHVICMKFNVPTYIYISNLAFFSGAIYKRYECNIIKLRLSHLKWCSILCLGLLTIFAIRLPDGLRPLFRFFWTFSFMALYATLPSIKTNNLWNYLNTIGLQVYLCQGIAFLLIPDKGFNGTLRTILIIGLTIIIASIVNKLYAKLNITKRW